MFEYFECAYCGYADTEKEMYKEYEGQLYCSLHDPEKEGE